MNLLIAEFNPVLLGLLLPLAAFIFVICIIAIRSRAATERQRQWHETARAALEKGQPIPIPPAALGESVEKLEKASPVAHDLRKGLLLIAVGAGMFLGNRESFDVPSVAYYIPGFLGLAFIANAIFTLFLKRKTESNETPVHQPKA